MKQLETEFRLASKYGQSDLAGKLLELGEIIRLKNGDPVPHCTQDESVSDLDLKAQGHKALGNICAICQGIPGSEGSIDGLQTKGSVMTQCCLQPYCLSCLKGTKGKCPSCRSDWDESKLTAVSGAICGFKWDEKAGRDYKIPVPGKAETHTQFARVAEGPNNNAIPPIRGGHTSHNDNNAPAPSVPVAPAGQANRVEPIAPLLHPNRAGAHDNHAPADAAAAAPAGLQPFREFHRVPAGLTQIGNREQMYSLNGLVWSDRAPENKTHPEALAYCRDRGGRLPTRAELEALSRALGFPDRYNPDQIPNMRQRFWSSTLVLGGSRAFGLSGLYGPIFDYDPGDAYSVRCVVEAAGGFPNRAGHNDNHAPADAAAAAPAGLQPFREFHGVPVELTQIGNREQMYRLNGLVWSDRAPQRKSHQEALAYCRDRGGRLPTRAELEALSRALGFPDQYNPNQIPDMRQHSFWSSDLVPGSPRRAFVLFGDDGRHFPSSFRCVVEVRG